MATPPCFFAIFFQNKTVCNFLSVSLDGKPIQKGGIYSYRKDVAYCSLSFISLSIRDENS